MSTQQYSRYLSLKTLQVQETAKLRTATRRDEPLDPYEPHLQQMRAAQPALAAHDDEARLRSMADFRASVYDMASTMRAAAVSPATSRTHLEPPDAYEAALDQMRKERR